MNFYVIDATVNGVDMEPGDEIGVFDGGVCVGVGVLSGGDYVSIIASKDDPGTSALDGYQIGHTASYRLWDADVGVEITSVSPSYLSGDGTFAIGATSSVNLSGTATNTPPSVSDIPGETIDEGGSFGTIDLDNYVDDIYTADEDILWTFSGNTDLVVSISTGRVATISTPGADWNGSETITFIATDDDASPLSASDAATFTVNEVNDPPEVGNIPNQEITKAESFTTINLDAYVDDDETEDKYISWTYSGNTDLVVSISTGRVATISSPFPNWDGSEIITFTATDNGTGPLFDNDAATFTVTDDNITPNVTDIPGQSIPEGSTFATINLNNYVSDIETSDANITWTYSGNSPYVISIVNNIATVTIPNADWYGSRTITFTATDDGAGPLSDSDAATFTVNPVNDRPMVTDIPSQIIEEGESFTTITLDNYVSDVETSDANISWTYSGDSELSVSISSGRVATISTPGADWNGSETITFTARDDDSSPLSDSDAATFTVNATNDPPVVGNIPNQEITKAESFTTINLDSYVSDDETDDEDIYWTYTGNTDLDVSISSGRVATISSPSPNWDGSETITFTARDDDSSPLSDDDAATFTVSDENIAPNVTDIPGQTVSEGSSFSTINLNNYVSDIETSDANITWTYSGNSPYTVSIVNNIATVTIPNSNWYGSRTITFTATDDGAGPLSDNDAATFTVNPVNDRPMVTDIPNQTIEEGESFTTITLDNYVSDVETSDANISWTYSGDSELSVSISSGRVATISIPGANWDGSETITFTATDDDSSPLSDSDAATFTVNGVNDPPVVGNIPNQGIVTGESFATIPLDDYVEDVETPDEDISWTYSGNSELSVSISSARVASISAPTSLWEGSETITFTAADDASTPLTDSDAAVFTITNDNVAPEVTDIPDQTIDEGSAFASINLDDFVTDTETSDEDIVWESSGATELIVSIVNREASITVPNEDWNGSETITFIATDDNPTVPLSDNDAVVFTVDPVNDLPIVSDIPDQTISEGNSFISISLDDYVDDVETDDENIVWTATGNTELSVTIVDRIASVSPPSGNWTGSESITFTATDEGHLSDEAIAIFEIVDENSPPVSISLSNDVVDEGVEIGTLVGLFTSDDPDILDTHTYTLISDGGVNDVDNGSFLIDGDTLRTNVEIDYETKTSYSILVQSDDGNGGTIDQSFIITVNEIGTSIDELKDQISMVVYPNPSHDKVMIKIENSSLKEFVLEIIDINGKVVYSGNIFSDKQLNISSYASGIYYIRVSDTNIKGIKKLVIL